MRGQHDCAVPVANLGEGDQDACRDGDGACGPPGGGVRLEGGKVGGVGARESEGGEGGRGVVPAGSARAEDTGRAAGRAERRLELSKRDGRHAGERARQHLLRHCSGGRVLACVRNAPTRIREGGGSTAAAARAVLAEAAEAADEEPLELGADGGALGVERPQRRVARLAELLALPHLLLLQPPLALLELEVPGERPPGQWSTAGAEGPSLSREAHARLLEPPLALGRSLLALPARQTLEQLLRRERGAGADADAEGRGPAWVGSAGA